MDGENDNGGNGNEDGGNPPGPPTPPPPHGERLSPTRAPDAGTTLGQMAAVGGVAGGVTAAAGGLFPQLQDAVGGFVHGSLERGVIAPVRDSPGVSMKDVLEFQFNPTDLTVTKTAHYKRDAKPKNGARCEPKPQYKGGQPTRVRFTLLLDGTTDAGTVFSVGGASPPEAVASTLDLLYSWTVVDVADPRTSSRNEKPQPPKLRFTWGNLEIDGRKGFTCHVTNLDVTISLFTPDGLPLRATAKLDLQEVVEATRKSNPTSGVELLHRRHRLLPGQSLQGVAHAELGNAAAWRAIAELNGIDDPARLRPGTELLLPRRATAGV